MLPHPFGGARGPPAAGSQVRPSLTKGGWRRRRSLHLHPVDQNTCSASGTLALWSSSSRCTASVMFRSPSWRFSRVRMFTVPLLCSFWPTTVGRGEG